MALCSPAAAQPTTPIGGAQWYMRVSPALWQHLSDNCMLGSGRYSPGRHEPNAWSNFPFFGDDTGFWDPGNATLSTTETIPGLHFASDSADMHDGSSWAIDAVGIEYRNGRAELTGVIRRSSRRVFGSKARRQVWAVIPHASLTFGLAHRLVSPLDDRGTVPNSLIARVRGKAYVAPAFVAAAGRWRCRGLFANYKYNRVRRGELMGAFRAEVAAKEARGIAGTLDADPEFEDSNGEALTVTPVGPATKLGWGIRFPIDASKARLGCDVGFDCRPAGDGLTVAGGFTLGYHGRGATVTDLAFSWAFDGVNDNAAITGTVDGQAMQIADANLKPSAAFREHVGQAVGAEIQGGFDVATLFTQTGPL
jgi:hypothetical protein